eukprot:2420762-Alexandrium_andersonii.AAC.1
MCCWGRRCRPRKVSGRESGTTPLTPGDAWRAKRRTGRRSCAHGDPSRRPELGPAKSKSASA